MAKVNCGVKSSDYELFQNISQSLKQDTKFYYLPVFAVDEHEGKTAFKCLSALIDNLPLVTLDLLNSIPLSKDVRNCTSKGYPQECTEKAVAVFNQVSQQLLRLI